MNFFRILVWVINMELLIRKDINSRINRDICREND